ncbi:MAG: hypothetical protein K2Q15_02285 [Burkholderiales bacterium]|nr:hypothetical protein [Burkholderiales bacterium]
MTSFAEFGLSKLRISAFRDAGRQTPLFDRASPMKGAGGGAVEAMYNPSSLDLRYDIDYDANQYINGLVGQSHYRKSQPGKLTLELLFDASLPGNGDFFSDNHLGINTGPFNSEGSSVEVQIAKLQAMCCEVQDSDTGNSAPYLRLEWGRMHWYGKGYFDGRIEALAVRYTRFDRKGAPLRAVATLTIVADESFELNQSDLGPLLTQGSVNVPDVSSLPLVMLGAFAAGLGAYSAYSYLDMAFANDMDSLDDLTAGDTLVTPSAEGGQ